MRDRVSQVVPLKQRPYQRRPGFRALLWAVAVPSVPVMGHLRETERSRVVVLPLVLPLQSAGTRHARRQLYEDALAIIEREYPCDLCVDGVAARIFTSR